MNIYEAYTQTMHISKSILPSDFSFDSYPFTKIETLKVFNTNNLYYNLIMKALSDECVNTDYQKGVCVLNNNYLIGINNKGE